MIDTRCGETQARLYCLGTGALLDWVEAEQGDTLQKVGLVPAPGPAHLLYTLVRGGAGRLAGAMYHTRQGAWLWRLELGAEFCLQVVLCSAPSVPQPVVQSRRRPLLGPSPG